MDITVTVEQMQNFLRRCSLGGKLISDLVIHINEGIGMVAKFATSEGNLYCEVYENKLTIKEEGVLKIMNLKHFIDVIGRAEGESIRIVSGENSMTITDGSKVGKFKSVLVVPSDVTIIDSYKRIEKKAATMFDRKKLFYKGIRGNYENGCELTTGILNMVLKDADAFKYQLYNFHIKKGKLVCTIKNPNTSEKFTRVIAADKFTTKAEDIPEVLLSSGFKEMISVICKKDSSEEKVWMYFHKDTVLLTDNKTYFFNLHTIDI